MSPIRGFKYARLPAALLLAFVIHSPVMAEVPFTYRESGLLLDPGSRLPIEGDVTFTFRLYSEPDNTVEEAVWLEVIRTSLNEGQFNLELGLSSPLLPVLRTYDQVWLGISVNDDEEMSPRFAMRNRNVPFAIISNDVIGDINPNSVSIDGSPVIDSEGNWVGNSSGLEGPQGQKGEQGDAGPAGQQGAKGDSGASGAQGPKGDKGDQGDQGVAGTKGDKGDQGDQGEVGLKWLGDWDSRTAYVLRDAVSSGGSSYVTIKANTNSRPESSPTDWQLLALAGEDGDKGDQGDQGVAGAKGDKGDQGDQGIAGAKGDKGDMGLTGAQGPKGDVGLTGPQGPKGDQGDKGDTGEDGVDLVFFAAHYRATNPAAVGGDISLGEEIFNSESSSVVKEVGGEPTSTLIAPYKGTYRIVYKVPASCVGPETAGVTIATETKTILDAPADYLLEVAGEVFVDLEAQEEVSVTHKDFDAGPGSTVLFELVRQAATSE